jgi:hypothetical protein
MAKCVSKLLDPVLTCHHQLLVQGSGRWLATGEVVPEELLPAAGEQQAEQQQQGDQRGGGGAQAQQHDDAHYSCRERRRRVLRQSEHGRRTVPEEGGPQDVQGLQGAQGGPRGHVRLIQQRRQPVGVRRHLRGQGRRLDARRRRAV